MTATLAPPPPPGDPAAAPEPPSPGDGTRRARRPVGPWVGELLLLAVTLVAVAGFDRLFASRAAVVPLLVAAGAAHVVGAIARRLGWGAAATAGITLVVFTMEASLVLYPHTSAYGLPTPASLSAIGEDLARAWDLFSEVRAPAPRSRGFLLASTFTLWLAVGLADWAAFRLRATVEAVLPAVAVFVFTVLLGVGDGGVVLTVLLVVAVLAFSASQRSARSAHDDAWVGGGARAGAGALGRAGAIVAVVVALAAGLVGPRVPSADKEALVDWRGDDGPDGRTTISPLVDIRSRLVEQSDATVFVVRTNEPNYWRLTALPIFNGQVWSSEESFGDADGDLDATVPDEGVTREVEQTFDIRGLGSIWAPAALTPIEVVESSGELRYNEDLATLIVPQDTDSIDGMDYTVISRVPSFQPEDLQARQPADLPDDVEAATGVPDDLPAVVADTAREAVADTGDTPYEQALALQQFFRSGAFDYSLDGVPPGHGSNAIVAFLRARVGYCEQFAGTYAAMARTLGLPVRVAVGFTQGERLRDGSGYRVRGRNAHAWPEVWISGAGWVPFEPTPGRGQPGAESYTGVPPDQVDDDPVDGSTTSTSSTTTPTATTAPGGGGGETTLPPDARGQEETGAAPPGTTASDGVGWMAVVGIVALVALVALLVDVAVIALVRRRRRRHGAGVDGTVAARVRAAWGRALDALGLLGTRPRPAETPREFARRAGEDLGPEGVALRRLAGLVTGTTWAPDVAHPDLALAADADALAGEVTRKVRATAGWKPLVRAMVDPRTLRG